MFSVALLLGFNAAVVVHAIIILTVMSQGGTILLKPEEDGNGLIVRLILGPLSALTMAIWNFTLARKDAMSPSL